jgi:hypothetical protein
VPAGNFANWLDHFKQEAMGAAIFQQTMASALNGITYDPRHYRARPFAKRVSTKL